MGWETWNHSRFLTHKVRNMMRRGWLIKTYNDGKLLCGRVRTGYKNENDEIDILHPVGYVAHVKPSEKTEIFTADIGADTSRRVITHVIGDREHHPPPDENEMWIYAPTEKKQFLRIKKKREQQGQGGGGGASGQSRAGQQQQQQGRQTKESGREPGIHQDGLEEKITSTTKSSYANKGEKGIGHESGGNFTVKSANSNQFQAGQKFMSKADEHHRESSSEKEFVKAVIHAHDHIAGGGTNINVASAPSSRIMALARANGNGSGGGQQGGQQQEQPGMEIPEEDGSHNWSAEGIPGTTSLLGTAAAVGTLGQIMQAFQQQQQQTNQDQNHQNQQTDQTLQLLMEQIAALEARVAALGG